METWNGFEKQEFEFEGRKAIVVLANKSNRSGHWMMKMEYWDAFPGVELAMVKRGWNLVYLENKHRWCDPEDLDLKKSLAVRLHEEMGFDKKFVPVGMSCGGIFAVQFAARYPEYVKELYLDAPVLNLLSCPADLGVGHSGLWEEYARATGMTRSQLICSRKMPMDQFPVLRGFSIPVAMVYGREDDVVPYAENGALLEEYYRYHEMPVLAIGKDGCGHHPHGLDDPQPVVDFLQEYMED